MDEIIIAVKANDLLSLQNILTQTIPPNIWMGLNYQNRTAKTALIIAAKNGNLVIVQHLLTAMKLSGADSKQRLELINHTQADTETALLCAIKNGHTDVFLAILAAMRSAYATNEQILDALHHTNIRGWTAFKLVIVNGHSQTLQALLNAMQEAGTMPDDLLILLNNPWPVTKNTPLIIASQHGYTNMIHVILTWMKLHARSQQILKMLKQRNEAQETAWIVAAKRNNTSTILALWYALQAERPTPAERAPILSNITDRGWSILMYLAEKQNIEIIETLLSKETPEEKLRLLIKKHPVSYLKKNTVLALLAGTNRLALNTFLENLVNQGVSINNQHMRQANLKYDIEKYKANQVSVLITINQIKRQVNHGSTDLFKKINEYLGLPHEMHILNAAKQGRVVTLNLLLKGLNRSEYTNLENSKIKPLFMNAQRTRYMNTDPANQIAFIPAITHLLQQKNQTHESRKRTHSGDSLNQNRPKVSKKLNFLNNLS